MLPELGHFCIILALCLSVLQSTGFIFGSWLNINTLNILRPMALGQVLFILLSFLVLLIAFGFDDFSVQYVALHSNSNLPIYYKLTALWGAHEGSLVLWLVILSCWMLAIIIASKSWALAFSNKILTVMSLVNMGFLILLLKSSNPFLRILPDAPLEGADLNPLLQDFGMIIHPPILYAGYVGCTVAFAFAIAGLLEGKIDQGWARTVRPWVLSSWLFLTLGIALGSWWAYYELGWGGWWFWDPVENASFMPWLTATALIHCLAIGAKNGNFLRLAVFLAITTFALSLLGTFLVRSGTLSSVHAFTTDPERGLFILQFLSIVVGGALLLYGMRAPVLKLPLTTKLELRSLDAAILANNVLLLVATGTVLLGTLYPLIQDVLFASKISVGYPYFNAVFIPIMLLLLSVMLLGVMPSFKILVITIIISISAAVLFCGFWFGLQNLNAVIGLSFAVAIILITCIDYIKNLAKNRLAKSIAHIGLAITIIGISITPAFEVEKDLHMNLGDTAKLQQYKVTFAKLETIDGPNYISYQGHFIVTKVDKVVAHLYPEKRLYLAQELPMTETAIYPGILQDIYIALGQQIDLNAWSVRLYYKPFIRCIWLGALLMSFGALCSVVQARRSKC